MKRVLAIAALLTRMTWADSLTKKDLTDQLPENLRGASRQKRTLTIEIEDRRSFEVKVHYFQLDKHPNVFGRIEIEVPKPPAGTEVSATVGNPVNMGTRKQPIMAVPFLLQWSGSGWLRTGKWTLSQGKLTRDS